MPIAAILALIAKYGPDAYAAAKQLATVIKNSGHPDLTPADIAELESFETSTADYLAAAGGAPTPATQPPAGP